MRKLLLSLVLFMCCSLSFAQSNINLDLKDAPVRTTLEMIFKQADIKNYVIEDSVSGFVTMTLTDQPFENSLKLVMRAATLPLTYTKENDVYIVKSRKIVIGPNPDPNFDLLMPYTKQESITWNIIKTTYIDPFDLQLVFGNILFINQFSRYTGGINGMGAGGNGGFSGFGGAGNSFLGGTGSFGMGNSNGFGGGGMGGFGGNRP
jgi:hypothetical protein